MTNLIISVNPFTNNIKVQTVQDSTASYNINVDDSFTFKIRGTLPNNFYSDFSFILSIVVSIQDCSTTSITLPTVSDLTYVIAGP